MGLWNNIWGWRSLNIHSGDLVLEVASGSHPFARADVLLDKFLLDSTERMDSIVIDRPFVCGDAECLPFIDGAFDYIYSSHTLEHMIHPERTIREFMRVGRKGYIVTPNKRAEALFGWDYHTHILWIEDDTLVLEQKCSDNWGYFADGYFHKAWSNDRDFRRFCDCHTADFEVRYEWEGAIDYRIICHGESALPKQNPAELGCFTNFGSVPLSSGLRSQVRSTISRLVRRVHGCSSFDLTTLLACPICRVKIRKEVDTFLCPECDRCYPEVNGIPVMLPEKLAGPTLQEVDAR